MFSNTLFSERTKTQLLKIDFLIKIVNILNINSLFILKKQHYTTISQNVYFFPNIRSNIHLKVLAINLQTVYVYK